MRQRPIKPCVLCRKERPLCDSHLIPASALRLIRARQERNPNPVNVSDTGHYTTSKPYKDYLLCEDCEKRFAARGEKWMSQNWYRGRGCFKLSEALQRSTPAVLLDDNTQFYRGASIEEIETDKLVYFGLSVIWRAGVNRWSDDHRTINIDLGPYLEPLRLFLLDETPFPRSMLLAVRVSSLTDYVPSVNYPESRREAICRYHGFGVLGVYFVLFVGKQIHVDLPIILRHLKSVLSRSPRVSI